MIKSFKHKGLRNFYLDDNPRLLNPAQIGRIARILDRLEASSTIMDMNVHAYRLHKLSGERSSIWSTTVSANWRITFRFENGAAYDIDLEDYH